MAAFNVEFIRFDPNGKEAAVVRHELKSETVFDAEREALRVRDEAADLKGVQFDAAFLRCGGPRVRRLCGTAKGVARWERA